MSLEIKNFGKNLKKMREYRGYTQKELAKKADVSYSYIVKIENDTEVPGNETILKLCNTLNIPMEFLLKSNGWREYTTYANSFIVKEMAKLPQDKFDMFSETLDLMIEMVKQEKGSGAADSEKDDENEGMD